MKKKLKFIGVLAAFLCIIGWVFYADHFAIDKTVRYRPLANGWVSYHAAMYLRGEGDFFDHYLAIHTVAQAGDQADRAENRQECPGKRKGLFIRINKS
ncbi:MAG: hypothetical protein D3922_09785, partial [Candidatus Electrothrix sp. AR1]|nr:hypothetical protein [Candidatus Electrothrix sp. AR1]